MTATTQTAAAMTLDPAAAHEVPEEGAASAWANDPAAAAHQRSRIKRWDALARVTDRWQSWGASYHKRLHEIYRFLIPPGKRVLEIGCGRGDLLAAVAPSDGVGVDFSGQMLSRARDRHPQLRFVEADAHLFDLGETFDYVILSDLFNDAWNVQQILKRVRRHCAAHTRVITNNYSRLWETPLRATTGLKMAAPVLEQNWLTRHDVRNLFALTGFEVLRQQAEVLLPLPIPGVAGFCNRFLVKLWPFSALGLTNVMVARPEATRVELEQEPLVSVIVPARNEAGNVPAIMARTPELGRGTELVFVEGNSSDDTYEAIERAIAAAPERRCKLFKQTGKGKGDAVRLGFKEASGDIVLILDADLTVPPEDLPLFVEALRDGRGEFINGVRLVYPMQERAMRSFNLLGNKFFSWAFTVMLGQPIRDSLCGTKVMWKRDYEEIAANRHYFGDFDPFGDFDLLFGAAKLNLKIIDLPIRYRERTYGDTNISRWKHGSILLAMVAYAARRLKFV